MPRHIHLVFIKCLRLYDEAPVHQNINAKFFLEFIALIADWHDNLCFSLMPSKFKLSRKTLLVERFRQANSKVLLHFQCSFKDIIRYRIGLLI